MKKFAPLHIALAIFCLAFTTSYAQDKPVKTLLNSYIKYNNTLNDSTSITKLGDLMHEKFNNNTTYVGLTGALKRYTSNLEETKIELKDKAKDNNYNFKLTLKDVVYESQKEKAGTISGVVEFVSTIDGQITEKGTILINLVATKYVGDWKIIQINTVKISERSEVGNCVSYLFSNGNSYFNSETYYPAGVKYNREFQSFRIGKSQGERAIVNRGDNNKAFIWKENGDVYNGKELIGKAEEGKDAIKLVIQNAYSKTCTEFTFN
jgi:hypothetical protein